MQAGLKSPVVYRGTATFAPMLEKEHFVVFTVTNGATLIYEYTSSGLLVTAAGPHPVPDFLSEGHVPGSRTLPEDFPN